MRPASRIPPAPRSDGVITALRVRRGRPDRIAVHLDGVIAFELATVVADEAGLRVGDQLTVEMQHGLLEQDAPHRARTQAVRFLAARDRSRHEVESRLRTSGFAAEVIAETVAWLQGLGYLDDARYASNYASERLKAGWGERKVRAELRSKGVDRATVERALEEEESPAARATGEVTEAVLESVRRRFGAQFGSDPEAASRRLAGFLGRRGYDWETVDSVARALRREVTEGSGAPSEVGPGAEVGPDT
jgi:regulatory protein